MNKIKDFDYEELKKSKDPMKYITQKAIEMTAKKMNVDEEKVRLAMDQVKYINALGYVLKSVRQRKRISVANMAQRLKIEEKYIKDIESEKIANFPIRLTSSYLNELGHLLIFDIIEHSKRPNKR